MICNWSLVLASLPAPKILLSATSGDIFFTWKEREREENLGPGGGGGIPHIKGVGMLIGNFKLNP